MNSSRLNPDILDEFNRLEIIEQLKDDTTANDLIEEVKALVIKAHPDK